MTPINTCLIKIDCKLSNFIRYAGLRVHCAGAAFTFLTIAKILKLRIIIKSSMDFCAVFSFLLLVSLICFAFICSLSPFDLFECICIMHVILSAQWSSNNYKLYCRAAASNSHNQSKYKSKNCALHTSSLAMECAIIKLIKSKLAFILSHNRWICALCTMHSSVASESLLAENEATKQQNNETSTYYCICVTLQMNEAERKKTQVEKEKCRNNGIGCASQTKSSYSIWIFLWNNHDNWIVHIAKNGKSFI